MTTTGVRLISAGMTVNLSIEDVDAQRNGFVLVLNYDTMYNYDIINNEMNHSDPRAV